jgi:hypothetical protein
MKCEELIVDEEPYASAIGGKDGLDGGDWMKREGG